MKKYEAKNLDEALKAAAADKHVKIEDLKYYVLEEKPGGLFGIGSKAIIEAYTFNDVRDFIGHKAIYDYEGIEKHMLMPADSISLDDLSIIYHKMNNDKKEGKEYPNDLILKCIYSSYEFLIDIDIDDFRKNQYIERLKKIGDDYIHELINLNDKDYESNANISEVDLRVKYLKRIIKLEDEINHLARVNADDLLVDLYSMKKRMTL